MTCFQNVRVVAHTEDCPARAFVSWSYRSVSLPPQSAELPDSDVVPASFDMYSKLVKLGNHLTDADLKPVRVCSSCRLAVCGCLASCTLTSLAFASQADISAALDNLRQKYSQYLPCNELVAAFCASEEVTPLEEYLDLFDSPVDVELEDERCWPPPAPLDFLSS